MSIFVLEDLSSARADFDTSIRGIIHNTQVVPLHARVPDLEPNRGQISPHFWSAWWSSCWSIWGFRVSPVWVDISPAEQGVINDTQAMFLNVRVTVLGLIHCDISRHFWSAWWPDLAPHRESTVSTALARKPWLAVYRAHSGTVSATATGGPRKRRGFPTL